MITKISSNISKISNSAQKRWNHIRIRIRIHGKIFLNKFVVKMILYNIIYTGSWYHTHSYDITNLCVDTWNCGTTELWNPELPWFHEYVAGSFEVIQAWINIGEDVKSKVVCSQWCRSMDAGKQECWHLKFLLLQLPVMAASMKIWRSPRRELFSCFFLFSPGNSR